MRLVLPAVLLGAASCRTAAPEPEFTWTPYSATGDLFANAVRHRPLRKGSSDAAKPEPLPAGTYVLKGRSAGDRVLSERVDAADDVPERMLPREPAERAPACPSTAGLGLASGDAGPELAFWLAIVDDQARNGRERQVMGLDDRGELLEGSASAQVVVQRLRFQPASGIDCRLDLIQYTESLQARSIFGAEAVAELYPDKDGYRDDDDKRTELGLDPALGQVEWRLAPTANGRWRMSLRSSVEMAMRRRDELKERRLNCFADKPIFAREFDFGGRYGIGKDGTGGWVACYRSNG